MALNHLSLDLSEFGRDEEALKANEEALGIYRLLAADQPEVFRPDLSRSLNHLSFAADCPKIFLPNLARSLNHLSFRLSKFGRNEEALKANEEALSIYRLLAADHPEVFHLDLADTLNDHCDYLLKFGRDEEALKATQELSCTASYRSCLKIVEALPHAKGLFAACVVSSLITPFLVGMDRPYSERREGDGYRKCRHCPQDIGLALTEFSAFAHGVTLVDFGTLGETIGVALLPIGSSSLAIPRSNPCSPQFGSPYASIGEHSRM
ncbi:hypothetical protein BS47DRAFT_1488177, partial [Hydnum rufescens UP504]